MEKKPSAALLDHFATLPDPRIARHRWHNLSDILVIAAWEEGQVFTLPLPHPQL